MTVGVGSGYAVGMPVAHEPVFSSHVSSIGYDAERSEMHVTYSSGRVVIHAGVPPDVARQVRNAPSVGQALHSMVRGKYDENG